MLSAVHAPEGVKFLKDDKKYILMMILKIKTLENKVNKFLSFLESRRVRGYRRFLCFYHFSQQLSCRVFLVREKRFSLRYFRIRRFLQAPQLRTFSLLILLLKKKLN